MEMSVLRTLLIMMAMAELIAMVMRAYRNMAIIERIGMMASRAVALIALMSIAMAMVICMNMMSMMTEMLKETNMRMKMMITMTISMTTSVGIKHSIVGGWCGCDTHENADDEHGATHADLDVHYYKNEPRQDQRDATVRSWSCFW